MDRKRGKKRMKNRITKMLATALVGTIGVFTLVGCGNVSVSTSNTSTNSETEVNFLLIKVKI